MRHALIRLRVSAGAACASIAMLFASASVALGHPLHTTITDLVFRGEERQVRATIRVFADDFARAVLNLPATAPATSSTPVPDSMAAAYVRSHFSVSMPDGRELPLSWCGARRSGDLVWVCVEAPWDGRVREPRVHNRMLFELYRDQVNVVHAVRDAKRTSLLFTRGDGPKPLR